MMEFPIHQAYRQSTYHESAQVNIHVQKLLDRLDNTVGLSLNDVLEKLELKSRTNPRNL